MKPRDFLFLVLGLLLGAAVTWKFHSGNEPSKTVSPTPKTVATETLKDTLPPARTPRSLDYRERLDLLPGADRHHPNPERAAILMDWIRTDRATAMAYLAAARFVDLDTTPGLAQAIGESASSTELLTIVNSTDFPWENLESVGRWASPGVLNGLAQLSPSFAPGAAARTTTALAGLLAAVNVDRAVEFARNQPTDELRGRAMSGVFDEMGSRPNGDSLVHSLYDTLPPAVRAQDEVAGSYGVAVWPSDPVAALQALAGVQDATEKKVDSIVLANAAASSAPEVAVTALYQSGLSPQAITNRVNSILQKWFAVDPQAAAKFLANSPVIPDSDKGKYGPGYP